MGKNYDNWERLVEAVLLREELRRVALEDSRNPSGISSLSSSFNSLSHDHLFVHSHHFPAAHNFERMNDFNWERLPPMDYQEMTPSSLSVFLDEKTGKKSYMVGARDLKIARVDNSQNWKWRFDAHSRFSEVAELQSVWRLDIKAKIKTKLLQPWTVYASYMVFKTSETAEGLESVIATIRFANNESDRDAAKRAKTVHLLPVKDIRGETAVEREDGWMEIEVGNFYVGEGDGGEVEVRVMEIRKRKTGLIVEGVVFRPTNAFMEAPLVSKQYMLTEVWG